MEIESDSENMTTEGLGEGMAEAGLEGKPAEAGPAEGAMEVEPERKVEGMEMVEEENKRKRLYVLLAVLLIVLVGVAAGTVYGFYKKRGAKIDNSVQSVTSGENDKFEEGIGTTSFDQNQAALLENNEPESANIEPSEEESVNEPRIGEQPSEEENAGGTPAAQEILRPDLTFAVLGDTQGYEPGNPGGGYQKAIKSIGNLNPDLIFSVGDLVSGCDKNCEGKLADWKKELGVLISKIYPAVGNHDRTGGDKSDRAWEKVFVLPKNGPKGYSELAYSFDFSNSHFVVLDSEKPEEHAIDSDQREWLSNDLRQNTKENTFVFFHEPAFPVSSKKGESLDEEKKTRDKVWSILDDFNVTAVFSGHEHLHSRRKINSSVFPGAKNEIYQFIVGNTDTFNHDLPPGGVAEYFYQEKDFLLVSVKGKEITVKVYSVGGKELNSFSFSK